MPSAAAAPSSRMCTAEARVHVQQPEVQVKVPPQHIVINQAQPAAPTTAAAPMMAPSLPMMAGMPAMMPAEVTSVASSNRAIPALGIDWIKIPIPIVRLFAVPAGQEVTMRMRGSTFAAAPAMMAAPAMVAAPTMMAAPATQMVALQQAPCAAAPMQQMMMQPVQPAMVQPAMVRGALGTPQTCRDPEIEALARQLQALDAALKERERCLPQR